VVCNGLGFWVRSKQDSSSPILATTSTNNKDEVDSDEQDLTDDIQVGSQPSSINNSSNFIASPDQSLPMSNEYFNINNDDVVIVNETSINEEPNNLSIDVIEYLDPSTGDSMQQHIGEVMKKCRSIVKLINKSSILMNYVLNLKPQFNIHRSLQLDCKSRWSSSYHLFEAVLTYKKIINKINSEKYYINLNKKQITKLSSIELDQDDWKMLELIEFVLKPVADATQLVSGSKYPTIGISYFAIFQIREFLEDVSDYTINDWQILYHLKSLLLKQVQKYFIDNNGQLEIMKVRFCFLFLYSIENKSLIF